MARQTAIRHAVLILAVTSVCTFGAAPLNAFSGGDDRFDEKPLPEFIAAMPAIRIDAYRESRPLRLSTDEPRARMFDTKSTPIAVSLYALMILDTKSTFDSSAWCPRCVEGNPYAAPFVNAGQPVAYGAGIAFDTGVMYLANRMRNSWNPAVRKIWFILPVALAVGHVVAIHHNYQELRSK